MRREQAINAVLRNYYTNPCRDHLERDLPWFYLVSDFTISNLEVTQLEGGEREFVAVLAAKIRNALSNMGEVLRAPTLPVHDEPMPEELFSAMKPQ